MTNEAYQSDEDVANAAAKRASLNDDIILCENTLYAQSPEPVLVAGSLPPNGDARSHGMFYCSIERVFCRAQLCYSTTWR